MEQNVLFSKGLNWVQHWACLFGLLLPSCFHLNVKEFAYKEILFSICSAAFIWALLCLSLALFWSYERDLALNKIPMNLWISLSQHDVSCLLAWKTRACAMERWLLSLIIMATSRHGMVVSITAGLGPRGAALETSGCRFTLEPWHVWRECRLKVAKMPTSGSRPLCWPLVRMDLSS